MGEDTLSVTAVEVVTVGTAVVTMINKSLTSWGAGEVVTVVEDVVEDVFGDGVT